MRAYRAVLACALCLSAAPVAAQDTASIAQPAAARQQPAAQKSGKTATLVSLIAPGAGHMYTGETGKGLILFGVGAGGVVLGIAAMTSAIDADHPECTWTHCELTHTIHSVPWFLAGAFVFAGSYIYGITDAGNSARRMNERNARKAGLGLLGTTVEPIAAPTPQGLALGMKVALKR